MASSGAPSYITDTPFVSGKAIDLSNGHVEILTGETEDILTEEIRFLLLYGSRGILGVSLAGLIISKGENFQQNQQVIHL